MVEFRFDARKAEELRRRTGEPREKGAVMWFREPQNSNCGSKIRSDMMKNKCLSH